MLQGQRSCLRVTPASPRPKVLDSAQLRRNLRWRWPRRETSVGPDATKSADQRGLPFTAKLQMTFFQLAQKTHTRGFSFLLVRAFGTFDSQVL